MQGERKKREWKEGWEEGREAGWEGRREGMARTHHLWCQLSCGIPAVTPVHNQMGTAPSEMQFRA